MLHSFLIVENTAETKFVKRKKKNGKIHNVLFCLVCFNSDLG